MENKTYEKIKTKNFLSPVKFGLDERRQLMICARKSAYLHIGFPWDTHYTSGRIPKIYF